MANLLIAVDAGHGGWDNGASYNGRLEKDDNLRLALEVQKQLQERCIEILMIRDTDVYVTLEDRARFANEAGADLFVSLHRNSYIQQTSWTNGVVNYIYLTAPNENVRAAQLVLDAVVEVGVQRSQGVERGNYYVLRRTNMPSMLLELGYIINEIDNQLFDEHLEDYAAAIVKGIMEFFGLTCQTVPCAAPAGMVGEAQAAVNRHFGLNMPVSGIYDNTTRSFVTRALQLALNSDFQVGLVVDGIFGPATKAAVPNVRQGQRGNVVFVIQALLQLNCYDPGLLDSIYGPKTVMAMRLFQRNHYLVADGVAGPQTVSRLIQE